MPKKTNLDPHMDEPVLDVLPVMPEVIETAGLEPFVMCRAFWLPGWHHKQMLALCPRAKLPDLGIAARDCWQGDGGEPWLALGECAIGSGIVGVTEGLQDVYVGQGRWEKRPFRTPGNRVDTYHPKPEGYTVAEIRKWTEAVRNVQIEQEHRKAPGVQVARLAKEVEQLKGDAHA